MVGAQTFLIVFTLLIPIITVASPHDNVFIPHRRTARIEGDWIARPVRVNPKRSLRTPDLAHGVEIELQPVKNRKEKRGLDNATIIDLASAHGTYVVPITIGNPAIGYPLQLDLGSSDILLSSTGCRACPVSLGQTINPYYNVEERSTTFRSVNDNLTEWKVGFGDGRTASGFVARENITLGHSEISGQVFGLINSTNLTLAEQQISGIIGLGFPRLSVLARALFRDSQLQNSSSSSSTLTSVSQTLPSSGSLTASATLSTTGSTGSPYLPPILESLVTTPHLPYPVFGLALSPPPTNSSLTSSSKPTSTPRFASSIGSLTLGGVSSRYVSDVESSGRTIQDIEWHQVVPFGRASNGDSTNDGSTRINSTASSPVSVSMPSSSTPVKSATQIGPQSSPVQKRQEPTSTSTSFPADLEELAGEEYLYWAIALSNVSINGTDIPLQSTYSYLGIPPIALLDVGFNGIAGPIDQVAKIFEQIPTARQISLGQWIAPCDTKMTLGFSFGGRYVQLQPSDWLYASVASSTFCLAWPVGTAPASDGIDWQLGTPFLKKVYSVFSYGINGEQAPLVGFLPLTDEQSVSTASTSANSSSVSPTSILYGPTPTTIIPYSATVTIATDLPNNIIPIPSYSLPSYIYTTDSTITPGAIQTIGLANDSAYHITQVPIVRPMNMSTVASSTTETVGGVGDNGGSASTVNTGGAGFTRIQWGVGLTSLMIGVAFGL